MASNLTLTQRWLVKETSRYPQKERVYADVDAALSYPTLRPKTDVYTYDDGRVKNLLCVHGLLPITFRGVAYNIPIACWVPLAYPKEPPLAYVVPTGDMLVRQSQDVDVSGLCKSEYLKNWASKPEGCNIRGLLEVMQEQFSRQPPVYAKPKAVPTSPPQLDPSQRPPPAIPPQPRASQQMESGQSSGNPPERPPPPPTRPPPPSGYGFASVSAQSVLSHNRQQSSGDYSNRPPPPIPLANPSPPQYVSPEAVGGQSDPRARPPQRPQSVFGLDPSRPPPPPPPPSIYPTNNYSPGPSATSYTPSPPVPSSPPHGGHWIPASSHSQPRSAPIGSPPPLAYSPAPLPRPHYAPATTQAPAVAAPRPPIHDFLGDDSEIVQSPPSVNASLAPAPPRPPNPQLLALHGEIHARLNAAMAQTTQTLAEDTQRLRATQADLLAGEPAIRDEMARLEAVRDVCRAVANRTREWVTEVERRVDDAKRRGEPEVDELVCSNTIVYNQLVDLVAEDNAIEDTMYHLHRALNAGRIDLDRFIKTTRELAEEQFMKRALIEKINQGTTLGGQVRDQAQSQWS